MTNVNVKDMTNGKLLFNERESKRNFSSKLADFKVDVNTFNLEYY